MFYMLKKKKIYPACVSKYNSSYSFNDSKWRRIALYYSKKITYIVTGNIVEKLQWFLLSELPLFFCYRKQT